MGADGERKRKENERLKQIMKQKKTNGNTLKHYQATKSGGKTI